MKIYKAAVAIEGEGTISQMDAIEHDGKFWLVPIWLENPAIKKIKPLRLILLDSLQHQRFDPPTQFGDFAVNDPIPKDVLKGRVQQQQGFGLNMYVVIEEPDLAFDSSERTVH